MLLNELVGVKKYTPLSLDDLIVKFAEHANYKKLGNGFFSYVFKHPDKDEVVKFWVKDDAYEKFLKYVEAHSSDPFLPKLKGKLKTISSFHHRLQAFPEKIKYVRLEKLEPLDDHDLEHYIKQIDWRFAVKEFIKNKGNLKYIPGLEGDVKAEAHPQLMKLVKALATIYGVLKDDVVFDIKPDNLMMRGDQIVITDPFYDDTSCELMNDLKDLDDDPALPHVSGKLKSGGKY